MWVFTEIADWFEKKRKQSDLVLDQWVENSAYSQDVIVLASITKAATTFGAGFVDLLKLGDGVKEGSPSGVGTDVLRFIAVFPVGKAASMIKSARGLSAAKLVLDTGGPNCFWIASAKAFAQINHKYKGKLLASVEDIAKVLEMPMENQLFKIQSLSVGLSYLERLGAKASLVKAVSKVKEIERMVPFDGSIVMTIVWVMKGKFAVGRHAIYAFRTTFGQVRYMDRTVGNRVKNTYKYIDDIAKEYKATSFIPQEAAIVHNVYIKPIAHDIHRLFIPVLGVIATKEK